MESNVTSNGYIKDNWSKEVFFVPFRNKKKREQKRQTNSKLKTQIIETPPHTVVEGQSVLPPNKINGIDEAGKSTHKSSPFSMYSPDYNRILYRTPSFKFSQNGKIDRKTMEYIARIYRNRSIFSIHILMVAAICLYTHGIRLLDGFSSSILARNEKRLEIYVHRGISIYRILKSEAFAS